MFVLRTPPKPVTPDASTAAGTAGGRVDDMSQQTIAYTADDPPQPTQQITQAVTLQPTQQITKPTEQMPQPTQQMTKPTEQMPQPAQEMKQQQAVTQEMTQQQAVTEQQPTQQMTQAVTAKGKLDQFMKPGMHPELRCNETLQPTQEMTQPSNSSSSAQLWMPQPTQHMTQPTQRMPQPGQTDDTATDGSPSKQPRLAEPPRTEQPVSSVQQNLLQQHK